jgi:hypothetical protein
MKLFLRITAFGVLWFLHVGMLPGRVTEGLLVFYDFASEEGNLVKDRSGVGEPLDLEISDLKGVERRLGELVIKGETQIVSKAAPSKVLEAVQKSHELTVEAWIRPENTRQEGPARMVSFSQTTSHRNFTLGQEKDRYDFRLRTTRRSTNGLPSIQTKGGVVKTELTHLVYTRQVSGKAALYVNGQVVTSGDVPGEFGNWDKSHPLTLANEVGGGRLWKGTYYLVAIYGRGLSEAEIQENFQAGHNAGSSPSKESLARIFERKVAPILSEHCLECHDASTRKGKLDLSRKEWAFAGGAEGPAIIPGKAKESLLWEVVESDEMPAKRAPLSAEEKRILKYWIDSGAEWSLEVIDPADYVHMDVAEDVFVQRLTNWEYINTVWQTTGVDVSKDVAELLPKDLRADGFSNTAYNLNVDLKHVQSYAQLAERIVNRMNLEAFLKHFQLSREFTDKNMQVVISTIGKWILRGPLTDEELQTYSAISTTAGRLGGDFNLAIQYVLEAMLQSPRFVYRIENEHGPLNDYELASRMSYILWGGPPDQELLMAADAGELNNPQEAIKHIDRLLSNQLAVCRSQQFVYEWLNLGRLDNLRPNTKHYPNWSQQLAEDMKLETLSYFEDVVWKQKRPMVELMNAQVTIVSPLLARHYGWNPQGQGASRYALEKVPGRGGLLTQGSVLTIGGDEASMVSRGLFILHDVLRGTVKDPPPCVDTSPVATKAGLTKRGIAEQRISKKSCGGCHAKFEPLAFGLEKFDGIGAYHVKDHFGNTLREDGNILLPGAEKAIDYSSISELMDYLAGSSRVAETITWKMTQFALGRPLAAGDRPEIEKIHQSATKSGGTYADTIRAIVMSDLVRNR